MSDRVYNDKGEVAVLVSPGFGAGWSTWNSDIDCLFTPEIVQMCLAEKPKSEIEARAAEIWPDGYWGGADDVQVVWIPKGTIFRIDEYDGSESIETYDSVGWFVA